MKNPKQLFEGKVFENNSEKIFLILKEIFKKNDFEMSQFLDQLGEENIKKIERFAHFYYFICQPYNIDCEGNDVREELQLIGIISLIEAMMQKIEYKTFFEWFESSCKELFCNNQIVDYKKTREEYLCQFSATRKIKKYFESYILETDQQSLLECIKIFNDKQKDFVPFDSIIKIAEIFYTMRSSFVHTSNMECLCPEGARLAYVVVRVEKKESVCEIAVKMKEFMAIFQRSFMKFWEEKLNLKGVEFDTFKKE